MDLFNPQQILPSISKQMHDLKAETLAQRAQNGAAKKSGEDLKSTAQEFESLLIYKMLEAMRRTVPKSGLLDSFSMDMYQSMMDQEMANELAKKGTFGLSQMVFKELNKLQEKLDENSATKQAKDKSKKLVNQNLLGDK